MGPPLKQLTKSQNPALKGRVKLVFKHFPLSFHPERTEIVKAFVVTGAGHAGDEALARELQEQVRHRLSAHAYPRRIEFVDSLPKTPSGKIQRFLLRGQATPER